MNKDGFWVQYHCEYGRGHTTTKYGYNFYKYEDGYTKEDEESFKMDAEYWAENEKGMWAKERYSYGYTILKEAPIEYINEKIKNIEKELEYYKSFIE